MQRRVSLARHVVGTFQLGRVQIMRFNSEKHFFQNFRLLFTIIVEGLQNIIYNLGMTLGAEPMLLYNYEVLVPRYSYIIIISKDPKNSHGFIPYRLRLLLNEIA